MPIDAKPSNKTELKKGGKRLFENENENYVFNRLDQCELLGVGINFRANPTGDAFTEETAKHYIQFMHSLNGSGGQITVTN
jgi:hypothetical protein